MTSNAAGESNRLPTGIAGLDPILNGGLLSTGVYMVQGCPGAGKTILANQICFNYAANGGRAVYVTLLAESHARLLQHLGGFGFFREEALPDSMYYVSAFEALRSDGLSGVVRLLRGEMRAQRAGLLVLDGLVMAARAAESDEQLKLFVSEIQAHASLTGCTTLLLASSDAERSVTAEQTMVDGIVLLRDHPFGPRRERSVEVIKSRGSATLRGPHAFRIGDDGIRVFPRIESADNASPGDAIGSRGVSSGVAGLDEMTSCGGFPEGSVTAVIGFAGTGKTTLGLTFVSRSSPESPGLVFSFYESPEFLVDIGRGFGLDLAALQASGALHFRWHAYGENILDELAYDMIETVRALKVKRLFVDGFGGFMAAPAYVDRGAMFFGSVANELRRAGVTTLISVDSADPMSRNFPLPSNGISALTDNLLTLRVEERRGELCRSLSIGKIRNCRYDLRIRDLVLDDKGLRIDGNSGRHDQRT